MFVTGFRFKEADGQTWPSTYQLLNLASFLKSKSLLAFYAAYFLRLPALDRKLPVVSGIYTPHAIYVIVFCT